MLFDFDFCDLLLFVVDEDLLSWAASEALWL